jgi:hypothetical protein
VEQEFISIIVNSLSSEELLRNFIRGFECWSKQPNTCCRMIRGDDVKNNNRMHFNTFLITFLEEKHKLTLTSPSSEANSHSVS